MGRIKSKKQVRDGFLGDLPESVQNRVMAVHKLVVETTNSISKDKNYTDIMQTQWAKSMLDEFLTMPADKKQTGSVRVYKQGKRYSCMIQLTGHVTNDRNDIDHELFHDMIRNVHVSMRPKVRRKYDMTLTCESEHGEHFEGFDVWTKQKEAKEIWELFSDKTTKDIREFKESTDEYHDKDVIVAEFGDLPPGLQSLVEHTKSQIVDAINERSSTSKYNILYGTKAVFENFIDNISGKLPSAVSIGNTYLRKNSNFTYEGTITVTPEPISEVTSEYYEYINSVENELLAEIFESVNEELIKIDSTKILALSENEVGKYFELKLIPEYAEKLFEYLEEKDVCSEEPMTESGKQDTQEYNTDMTEAEAKKTLRTLSQNIMDKMQNDKNYKVTQYTANIYANIITKNLLLDGLKVLGSFILFWILINRLLRLNSKSLI